MKLVILSVILLVHSIYSSPTPQNIDIGAVPNQVGQFIAQVPNQVANFVSQVPNQVSNFVSQAPNQFGNFVSQFSNLIQRPPQWNIFQPQNQMQTIPQVQTIQVQPSEWPQIIQVPFRQSANNNNNNNGNGNGWFFPNFIPNWFNVPLFQNQVGHDPTTIVIIARPKPQGASTTTEAVPVSSTSESTSETTSTVSTSETTPGKNYINLKT